MDYLKRKLTKKNAKASSGMRLPQLLHGMMSLLNEPFVIACRPSLRRETIGSAETRRRCGSCPVCSREIDRVPSRKWCVMSPSAHVWMICAALDEEGIFRVPGSIKRVTEIQEAFDKGIYPLFTPIVW